MLESDRGLNEMEIDFDGRIGVKRGDKEVMAVGRKILAR